MNILSTCLRRLFTFVCKGTTYAEFNSVALFTVLYSRFKHCAKDVSKVTAQRTILEYPPHAVYDVHCEREIHILEYNDASFPWIMSISAAFSTISRKLCTNMFCVHH